MFLEVATTLGALAGAVVAVRVSPSAIAVVLGVVLAFSVYLSNRRQPPRALDERFDPWASRLRMSGSYPTPDGPRSYRARAVPAGSA